MTKPRKYLTNEGWMDMPDANAEDSVVSLLDEMFEILELDGGTPMVDVLVEGIPAMGVLQNERLVEILYRLQELRNEYEEIDTED